MRIKIFIITYRNNAVLNTTLRSLSASDVRRFDHEITVINNDRTSQVATDADERGLNIDYWSNCTRPPFSRGHLARNWNESIVNGLVDLDRPDCDIVLCCQNDILFKPNAFAELTSHMRGHSFITYGAGDACCAITADAVRKSGLYDERFANIAHQETDYFYRQFLYNRPGCSINDYHHGNVWNPLDRNILIGTPTGYSRGEPSHVESLQFHHIAICTFRLKWGFDYGAIAMKEGAPVRQPLMPQFMLYPYFECKIADPASRGYVKYA